MLVLLKNIWVYCTAALRAGRTVYERMKNKSWDPKMSRVSNAFLKCLHEMSSCRFQTRKSGWEIGKAQNPCSFNSVWVQSHNCSVNLQFLGIEFPLNPIPIEKWKTPLFTGLDFLVTAQSWVSAPVDMSVKNSLPKSWRNQEKYR